MKKLHSILLLTFILTSITVRQVAAEQAKVGINPENQTISEVGLSLNHKRNNPEC
jgi:hypothetical protein